MKKVVIDGVEYPINYEYVGPGRAKLSLLSVSEESRADLFRHGSVFLLLVLCS